MATITRAVRAYTEDGKYFAFTVSNTTTAADLQKMAATKWKKESESENYCIMDVKAYPEGEKCNFSIYDKKKNYINIKLNCGFI